MKGLGLTSLIGEQRGFMPPQLKTLLKKLLYWFHFKQKIFLTMPEIPHPGQLLTICEWIHRFFTPHIIQGRRKVWKYGRPVVMWWAMGIICPISDLHNWNRILLSDKIDGDPGPSMGCPTQGAHVPRRMCLHWDWLLPLRRLYCTLKTALHKDERVSE